jgi:hypothetical protein
VLGLPATIVGSVFLVFVVYGGDSPDWTSPATGILMSVLLLAIGYGLRTDSTAVEGAKPSPDSTAE